VAAYYNEIDPNAADVLRELIRMGEIPAGDVDERSIMYVAPEEIKGYAQKHFFAGIGGWALALRTAGWADDRPVTTGSCPCQSFSSAGKRLGFADERHLWPAFFWHIQHGQPGDVPVFGEQVASKDGLAWLDVVQTDLEGAGFAVGAHDSCSAGFGAPHIRQRLYWVADPHGSRYERYGLQPLYAGRIGEEPQSGVDGLCSTDWAAHPQRLGNGGECGHCSCPERTPEDGRQEDTRSDEVGHGSPTDGVAHASNDGLQGRVQGGADAERQTVYGQAGRMRSTHGMEEGRRPGPTNGHWGNVDWLFCRDGKWRPTESGVESLVDGLSHRLGYSLLSDIFYSLDPLKESEKEDMRIGRLRGYGNAINVVQAAEFISAYMQYIDYICQKC